MRIPTAFAQLEWQVSRVRYALNRYGDREHEESGKGAALLASSLDALLAAADEITAMEWPGVVLDALAERRAAATALDEEPQLYTQGIKPSKAHKFEHIGSTTPFSREDR